MTHTPNAIDPNHPLLVFVDGLDAAADGRGYGKEHEKARHLLEAAPELLEALKFIKERLEIDLKPTHNQLDAIWKRANEAIAKAEGK